VVLAHAALICVLGAEQEAAVEVVGVLVERATQLGDPAIDVVARHAGVHPRAHLGQLLQPRALDALGPEPIHVGREVADTGERGGEDDAGVVAQGVRQLPAVGQLGPARRVLVVLDERDPRVAQRVDAGGDRQLRLAPQRGDPVGVDAELLGQVERSRAARELDHVRGVVDRLERA
jgi:hypothetical protein